MPTIRRSALVAATAMCVALLVPRTSRGEEEAAVGLSWEREGYATILDAAVHAKTKGRRLLLGLSGSPT